MQAQHEQVEAFEAACHREAGGLGDHRASEIGPCDRTERRVDLHERLSGITAQEEVYFWSFLKLLGREPDEIHTDVAVGQVETIVPDESFLGAAKLAARIYPWRVDVAIRFGSEWWIVECKQRASHYVLGQVCTYAYCWWRDCPQFHLARCVVATDACSDDVMEVAAAMGIDVVRCFGNREENVPCEAKGL